MKILYSPQMRADGKKICYSFIGEIITAEYDGLTNAYDLSEMQEDFRRIITNENCEFIEVAYISETVFSFSPIINAYRDNCGKLWVELLNFIDENATEKEKNPNWIEA